MLKNTQTHYGTVSKFFHWLIFLLIATLIVVGFFMDDIANKDTKMQVYGLHKSFGLTVLLLVFMRLSWTMNNPRPEYPNSIPVWQRQGALALHCFLYLLMFLMPISGWIMSTAAGYPPSYFGFGHFSFPGVGQSKSLQNLAQAAHFYLAWAIIASVSLHVLAALKHHFIDRNGILRRMLPFC